MVLLGESTTARFTVVLYNTTNPNCDSSKDGVIEFRNGANAFAKNNECMGNKVDVGWKQDFKMSIKMKLPAKALEQTKSTTDPEGEESDTDHADGESETSDAAPL